MEEQQNTIMLTIDLSVEVADLEHYNEPLLMQEFSSLIERNEVELDNLFRMTCRQVAVYWKLILQHNRKHCVVKTKKMSRENKQMQQYEIYLP